MQNCVLKVNSLCQVVMLPFGAFSKRMPSAYGVFEDSGYTENNRVPRVSFKSFLSFTYNGKMPDTEKFAVKDVVSRYESFEFFARHQMALRHNLIQRRTKVSLSILQRENITTHNKFAESNSGSSSGTLQKDR